MKITEREIMGIIKEAVYKILDSSNNAPKLNEVYESTNNNSEIVPINETNAKDCLIGIRQTAMQLSVLAVVSQTSILEILCRIINDLIPSMPKGQGN